MAEAFRVGVERPSDESIHWGSGRLSHKQALERVFTQLRKHKGAGYRRGARGEDLGPKRTLAELQSIEPDVLDRMRVGDVERIRCLKDGTLVFVRRVQFHREPETVPTAGNSAIDRLYALVFRELPDWGQENWGICNRRPIAGTSIWSQHCPWPAPDDGSNAIDIGGIGKATGDKLAAALVKEPACGKILWNGRAWDRERGWRVVPGIGHDDHLHVEGPRTRTGQPLASC